jgi:hypothetical protein
METQHWLDVAASCGYLSWDEKETLESQLQEIGRMLNAMMAKANLFCRQDIFIIQEEESTFILNKDTDH